MNLKRPVPDLSKSLSQWVESCLPWLSPFQTQALRLLSKILNYILKPAQKRLFKLSETEVWTDFCMQDAYLSNRLPISFFSNVFYLFEDDPECNSAADRATALILSALDFYHADPESYLFSTARIPGHPKDRIQKWKQQSHIIIAVLGSFYRLELSKASASCLKNTLLAIIEDAQNSKLAPAIGSLTTLPRESWSQIHQQLNPENLETIQSAVLFVAIDLDTAPISREEKLWAVAHQNPENRWCDKTHQIVVFKNGKAGITRDHTLIDGLACVTYLSKVYQGALEKKPLELKACHFKKLNWEINAQLSLELKKAADLINQELSKREMLSFDIPQQNAHFSDAAFQIAIQLAAYRYFGKLVSTSEAVIMNHFTQGRYDTIWCVTQESKKFILEPTQNNLANALLAHKKLVKACKLGNSPALHLSALKSFSWLTHCTITSSQPAFQPGYELGGYTDTEQDVIGIIYLIFPNKIQVCIKTDNAYFGTAHGLKESLIQAVSLINSLLSSPV